MERVPRELQRFDDNGRAVSDKLLDQIQTFLLRAKAEL